MSKGLKVFIIVFVSVVAAIVTADVLTEIFKFSLKKSQTTPSSVMITT